MQDRSAVFVVDDDPGILISLRRLLRANGYESLLFSSAKDFEEHDHFEDACCVLLDINLKDGSGIELRYGLTAAGRAVPVIFMTGNDNPTVRDAALESGCLAYLTKPFSAKSLIEPIERACARR
ncbi:MAG TPA: response regulator [Chthoniobacterales bacterium]|nr:response regulator [Bradyrhizobium sp.]